MGFGTTSDGTLVSTRDVLKLAEQSEILPVLLATGGAVLELGRTQRVNADGLPAWTPPRWVDRSRTPMVNRRSFASTIKR